jgi:hypothetical protein
MARYILVTISHEKHTNKNGTNLSFSSHSENQHFKVSAQNHDEQRNSLRQANLGVLGSRPAWMAGLLIVSYFEIPTESRMIPRWLSRVYHWSRSLVQHYSQCCHGRVDPMV